jgi:hypothetical protein
MRFLYTLFSLALLLITLSCSDNTSDPDNNNNNDTLFIPEPNFDFEEWTQIFNDDNQLMFEEPAGKFWTTLNKLKLLGGPITTEKSEDAHSGQYAARLETKQYGTFVITGLLLAGEFDPVKYEDIPNFVNEGQPFFEKPLRFKGYYKYSGIENDSGGIYIGITKYNKLLNKKDTIAEASMTLGNSDLYQLFNLELDYYLTDVEPDTMKITFISSAGGSDYSDSSTARVGSVLYIDDLSLELADGKVVKLSPGSR